MWAFPFPLFVRRAAPACLTEGRQKPAAVPRQHRASASPAFSHSRLITCLSGKRIERHIWISSAHSVFPVLYLLQTDASQLCFLCTRVQWPFLLLIVGKCNWVQQLHAGSGPGPLTSSRMQLYQVFTSQPVPTRLFRSYSCRTLKERRTSAVFLSSERKTPRRGRPPDTQEVFISCCYCSCGLYC